MAKLVVCKTPQARKSRAMLNTIRGSVKNQSENQESLFVRRFRRHAPWLRHPRIHSLHPHRQGKKPISRADWASSAMQVMPGINSIEIRFLSSLTLAASTPLWQVSNCSRADASVRLFKPVTATATEPVAMPKPSLRTHAIIFFLIELGGIEGDVLVSRPRKSTLARLTPGNWRTCF